MGVCTSLLFLLWQPTVFYAAVLYFILIFKGKVARHKRTLLFLLLGNLFPLFIVFGIYAFKGRVKLLWDGLIFFNLKFINRPYDISLGYNIKKILKSLIRTNSLMFYPTIIGFMSAGYFVFKNVPNLLKREIKRGENLLKYFIILTFPFPLILSLLDYQGYADFYIFLPYVVLGLAKLLFRIMKIIGNHKLRYVFALTLSFFVIFLSFPTIYYDRPTGLIKQKKTAYKILQIQNDPRIVSIGAPEILALLNLTNPNQFNFIVNGIDEYIEYTIGIKEFNRGIVKSDVNIIIWGSTNGVYKNELKSNIKKHYKYEKRYLGKWEVFIKTDE